MTLYYVIRDVINKETCLKMVPNCNAFVTLLGPDTKKTLQVPSIEAQTVFGTKPTSHSRPTLIGPTQNRTNSKSDQPKLD